jgi:hypothetical protein
MYDLIHQGPSLHIGTLTNNVPIPVNADKAKVAEPSFKVTQAQFQVWNTVECIDEAGKEFP